MEDTDIWLSAGALVKVYGAQAESRARSRADRALLEGDAGGFKLWCSVSKAAAEIARTGLVAGDFQARTSAVRSSGFSRAVKSE